MEPETVKHAECGTPIELKPGGHSSSSRLYCPQCRRDVALDELDPEGPYAIVTDCGTLD